MNNQVDLEQSADRIQIASREYSIAVEPDTTIGVPWKFYEGHGPVSEWTTRGKRAQERILAVKRRRHSLYLYYDYAEACKIALKNWGCKTKKEAAEAADRDFKRLQAFCNDEWSYVTIIVTASSGETAALGGIESDDQDGIIREATLLAKDLYEREFGPQPDMFVKV